MGTVLEAAAQNAACDAIVDQLDGGTIEYQIAAGTEVATLTLGTPAFGAAAAGVSAMNTVTPDSSATGNANPVTKAVFKAAGGGTLFTVPVIESQSPGPDEIGLTNTTFNAGDPADLTAYTFTVPTGS